MWEQKSLAEYKESMHKLKSNTDMMREKMRELDQTNMSDLKEADEQVYEFQL